MFCFSALCVFSSFAIIPLGKRELVALFLLCFECHVPDIVLRLFLDVPLFRLWSVIVVFPDLTHLLLKGHTTLTWVRSGSVVECLT